ncbi:hypothetical protein PIB30_007731 [Stylosanthes scabra]|uniref:Gag-pol polyprotein n=1 Tax=Stylosanthes scabra TaxID=79078 RepID=A0ABU6Y4P1_9FABA|nr:hypothetical protein [Stylosanthes scabra]
MRVWIRAQDARIWKIVEEGYQIPTKKKIQKVNGKGVEVEVHKPQSEWTDEDWKKMSSSNKAINFLHCALTQDVYMIISSCKTTKEIWDKLNVTYEEDKRKAYVSMENEDDSSTTSDEDEDANICFISNEYEVNDSNYSNNELQDAYDKLLEEFVKVSQENSVIKKINAELQKENEVLKSENITLGKVKTNSTNDTCKSYKHSREILKLGLLRVEWLNSLVEIIYREVLDSSALVVKTQIIHGIVYLNP